ncbi:MAG TPA: 3-oxoacyl-[acyl-carrier-protein] synthase III C-terminal domain-containing protein [Myxococcota bacterium]|nr:3-oxoacyl-[acyl-carrier-protein] synthase III C-terminal domain-containing protein [Myxococcota bacterium]
MLPLTIARCALHAPSKIETAGDLSPRVGRSADWIKKRSRVHERRIHDGPVEVLAAEAIRGLELDEPPELLINCGLTPRQLIPDTSTFVARELGWSEIPTWSIHATCMGFFVGLQQAAALLAADSYERIVLVAAERGSICRDFDQPESSVLIGDGAGAALVTRGPGRLIDWRMKTFPEHAELAQLQGCGIHRHPNNPETQASDNLFHMAGPRLYRHGLKHMTQMLDDILGDNGIERKRVKRVVPHQASGPATDAIVRYFSEEQVVDIIGSYGNCIAASMPMALATVADEMSRGDILLMMGTGAGLSVGAALLEW